MNQKGSATIILVLLIAVLLAGGVGYMYVSEQPLPVDTEESNENYSQKDELLPASQKTQVSKTDSTTKQKAPKTERGTITVEVPNGGEIWQVGHTHTFRWRSEGANKNQSVEINLLRKSPGDSQFWHVATLASGESGTGQYSWDIKMPEGSSPNSQFKILVGRALARGDGESDQTDGYFTITPIPNYPEVCETGKEDKNFCYANSPLFNLNIIDLAFCNKIGGPESGWLKENCINSVAVNRSDVSLCIGNVNPNNRGTCYERIAIKTNDLKICGMMPQTGATGSADTCYDALAKKNHLISICDKMSIDPSPCYYYSRTDAQKSDVNLCAKMNNKFYRSYCYLDAAVANDDVRICENIDPNFDAAEMQGSYKPYNACLEKFE